LLVTLFAILLVNMLLQYYHEWLHSKFVFQYPNMISVNVKYCTCVDNYRAAASLGLDFFIYEDLQDALRVNPFPLRILLYFKPAYGIVLALRIMLLRHTVLQQNQRFLLFPFTRVILRKLKKKQFLVCTGSIILANIACFVFLLYNSF